MIEKFAHERAAGSGTKGLFLYLAWHNTHTPLECPPEFMYPSLPAYNNSFKARMTYNCMARILDEGVGNVTRTLKSNGLWNETLMFFSADNGSTNFIFFFVHMLALPKHSTSAVLPYDDVDF